MKKLSRVVAILCFSVLVLGVGWSQSGRVPVLPHADPFITLHPVGGKYLLLATTGKNITLWSGPTVLTAGGSARVVFTPTDGLEQLWSPTLWQFGDRWWIYFTAQMPGKAHAIYALESESADPAGSYSFRGSLDLGRPAIDPSLLMVGGVRYLMYVTVDRGENAIQMVKLSGPMQVDGPGSLIAEPEYPWERGARSTRNYPVDEGPTALYHEGKTYVVFSASDTASPLYCLGLLTLTGSNPLDRKSWSKKTQPIFSAAPAEGVYGPGRGTFAQSADGRMWLLYAAKPTDAPSSAGRATWAQTFTWATDGTPDFGAPRPQVNETAVPPRAGR